MCEWGWGGSGLGMEVEEKNEKLSEGGGGGGSIVKIITQMRNSSNIRDLQSEYLQVF